MVDLIKWGLVNVTMMFLNLGIVIGLTAGALLLLRPLLVRLLSPRKRTYLWLVVWLPAYLPTVYGVTNILGRWFPFNFRSLVSPRTGESFDIPTYFPDYYRGTGQYNLALPSGELYQVELHETWMTLLMVIWLVGVIGMILYTCHQNKKLMARARQGEVLAWNDPLLQNLPEKDREYVLVRICTGLPTSFVHQGKEIVQGEEFRYGIYLQKELPPEQMALVLRHEGQHMRLNHCGWKWYANIGLILYWWNPMIWLAYRYFCQDLELACDRAVLDELNKEERRNYARALVEISSGRQLWEAPLSFGECDAQLRVKAVVNWKPSGPHWGLKNVSTVALTVLLLLFFLAGPGEMVVREEDRTLAWQQEIVYDEVAEFPPSSYYRQDDAPTLRLTELWMKAEDAEGSADWLYESDKPLGATSPWLYGKAEDGSWWIFQIHWQESRGQYQAYLASEAPEFPERLNGPEKFVQIK